MSKALSPAAGPTGKAQKKPRIKSILNVFSRRKNDQGKGDPAQAPDEPIQPSPLPQVQQSVEPISSALPEKQQPVDYTAPALLKNQQPIEHFPPALPEEAEQPIVPPPPPGTPSAVVAAPTPALSIPPEPPETQYGQTMSIPLNIAIEPRREVRVKPILICAICGRGRYFEEMPRAGPTMNCYHGQTRVCSECARNKVEEQIKSDVNPPPAVKCPVSTCGRTLTYQDIRACVSPDAFQKYEAKRALRQLEAYQNYVICSNCRARSIHPPGRWQPMFTCPDCQHLTCFIHGTKWDVDQTCADCKWLQHPSYVKCISPGCSHGDFRVENNPRFSCSSCGTNFCIEHRKLFHPGTCQQYTWALALWESDPETYLYMYPIRTCPSCRRFVDKDDGCQRVKCLCGRSFLYNEAPFAYARLYEQQLEGLR